MLFLGFSLYCFFSSGAWKFPLLFKHQLTPKKRRQWWKCWRRTYIFAMCACGHNMANNNIVTIICTRCAVAAPGAALEGHPTKKRGRRGRDKIWFTAVGQMNHFYNTRNGNEIATQMSPPLGRMFSIVSWYPYLCILICMPSSGSADCLAA